MSNILEMSTKTMSGRKPITFIAHEIYQDDTSTNKNGLHWKKEYVENNIESLKGMPICCEFTDEDKEIPLGHGYTGTEYTEDGAEPLFENSVVVGSVESGEIKNVVVDGNETLALVCYGFIYVQRFPKFHDWLKENTLLGNVDTSIEITGISGEDIVYENNFYSKEFRTPEKYQYSGSAILSVSPADNSAIVLEVAQELNKEEFKMDEKVLKDLIVSTISETNSKNDEISKQVTELNTVVEEKDAKITELNATVEELQKALEDLKKEQKTSWAERDLLEQEVAKAKVAQRLGELDKSLESFSEDEKKFAECEINAFKENPLDGDVKAIVSKIYAGIGETAKQTELNSKTSEQNSEQVNETIDIFSEINSAEEESDEDTNIF